MMNRSEWTILLLKLYAIYLLVGFISEIPGFISGYIKYGDNELGYWLVSLIMALLVTLFFVWVFWFYSHEISNRIWSDINEDQNNSTPSATDIHYAIFSGIGIYICVTTFPHFITLAAETTQQYIRLVSIREQVNSIMFFNVLAVFIKLVFGIVLLLGSKRIVYFLKWLQNYGLEKC